MTDLVVKELCVDKNSRLVVNHLLFTMFSFHDFFFLFIHEYKKFVPDVYWQLDMHLAYIFMMFGIRDAHHSPITIISILWLTALHSDFLGISIVSSPNSCIQMYVYSCIQMYVSCKTLQLLYWKAILKVCLYKNNCFKFLY